MTKPKALIVGPFSATAGGVVTFQRNLIFHSDLQARCGGLCPPAEAGAIAEGRDLELAGILTGVGAAVIGAGAVVLLIIGLAAGEPSLADGRVEF